MPRIFINYRVRSQTGYAALLDRTLAGQFGAGAVFRDSRSVVPGDDFVTSILGCLRRCSVVLAIIGPGWPDAGRSGGAPGGDDWVVAEIAEALGLGIRVVPILVDGASPPRAAALPAQIAALARCQAIVLRPETIDSDLDLIVAQVGRVLMGDECGYLCRSDIGLEL